jgi:hypothetical protein
MNGYVLAAYAVGFALIWGYAGLMWLEGRSACRHAAQNRANVGGRP